MELPIYLRPDVPFSEIGDCSQFQTNGKKIDPVESLLKFKFDNNGKVIKNIEVRNFEDGSTSYIARGLNFSNCQNMILQNMVVHNNGGDGCVMNNTTAGTSYIINCDFYNNADFYYNGESADGMEIFSNGSSAAWYVKGCRFWQNSDDGLDFFDTEGIVHIDSCWSFQNGSGTAGDGNGFKLGRATTDLGVPQRIVRNCISASNLANAYDQNEGNVEMQLYNNLAYNNGVGYVLDQGTNPIDIKNCTNYSSGSNWFNGYVTQTTNSWNIGGVDNSDFQSLDVELLKTNRTSSFKLPTVIFGKLAVGSNLIDVGTNVGLSYIGSGPDVGYVESY